MAKPRMSAAETERQSAWYRVTASSNPSRPVGHWASNRHIACNVRFFLVTAALPIDAVAHVEHLPQTSLVQLLRAGFFVPDTLAALGPQRHLDAQRQREQAPGGVKGAVDGLVVNVVAGDVKEPRAASRDVEFRRRGSLVVGYRGGPEPSAAHQRGDVHARDGPDGFEHRVPSGCVGDAFVLEFWREA